MRSLAAGSLLLCMIVSGWGCNGGATPDSQAIAPQPDPAPQQPPGQPEQSQVADPAGASFVLPEQPAPQPEFPGQPAGFEATTDDIPPFEQSPVSEAEDAAAPWLPPADDALPPGDAMPPVDPMPPVDAMPPTDALPPLPQGTDAP